MSEFKIQEFLDTADQNMPKRVEIRGEALTPLDSVEKFFRFIKITFGSRHHSSNFIVATTFYKKLPAPKIPLPILGSA